jgi:hypothetical protein
MSGIINIEQLTAVGVPTGEQGAFSLPSSLARCCFVGSALVTAGTSPPVRETFTALGTDYVDDGL